MDLPTIGRIVHYVMRLQDYDGTRAGAVGDDGHRAAIIVRVNKNTPTVNLCVFMDGFYDGHVGQALWVLGVSQALSEAMDPAGTWHWPEREPAQQYNQANLQFIQPLSNVALSATFPMGATYDVQSATIDMGCEAQDQPAEDGGEEPQK
jgi:hypothetical protein